LVNVRIDISNAKVHASEFDKVPTLDELTLLWQKFEGNKWQFN
jgi:hypothetical protein